jgi:hypothetical protein|tara:strand:- start:200 stop:595 length:396 start_codon:yes stop_codon:yes gene_type:complete
MAGRPNIVGVSTITGVTTSYSHSDAHARTLVSNGGGSEQAFKINNITIANVDNTNAGLVTVKHHLNTGTYPNAPGAGTSISIVNQLGIATGTSVVVLDRAAAFYLQEGESISVQANVANLLESFVSYEIIE